jgi:uncharacterized membrane protein
MQNLTDQIKIIHRYLLDQSLYPILLSTAFALVLFSLRVIESYTLAYSNLIWNLFLAWVPFLFSLWAVSLYNARAKRRWIIILPGLLWLLFFPNAPYIITDFLHLKERPGIPIWYDILMLAAFTWTGFFLAITSLRTMQLLVKKHVGWLLSWIFAGFVLALAGVGIYLGRFSRWNSWDIFFSPREILLDVAVRVINPLSNLNFYGFTSIITALLVISYIMFISLRREPKIGA